VIGEVAAWEEKITQNWCRNPPDLRGFLQHPLLELTIAAHLAQYSFIGLAKKCRSSSKKQTTLHN
jgi:hypothetical protein